jgi:hypothetical protein
MRLCHHAAEGAEKADEREEAMTLSGLIVALLFCAWWITSWLSRLEKAIRQNSDAIASVSKAVEALVERQGRSV